MTTFFHVVGEQGVGKSMVILALANDFEARGQRCAGQDPDVFTSRREALEQCPHADVYFIEYLREEDMRAFPGEIVVRLSMVPRQPEAGVA